jgi:glycerol uptake facilitator-like aquaporin
VNPPPVGLRQRALAEALGSAFLVTAVIGSGVMASRLTDDAALRLLANSVVTGAALTALILALRPVSASFNPVVTGVEAALGRVRPREAGVLVVAQVLGASVGAVVANLMFDLPVVSVSSHHRVTSGAVLAEVVATLGLVVVVLGSQRFAEHLDVAIAVGGYITAAYWFTASTSFANPAVTVARTLSDTFAGIAPASVPAFVLAQLAGATLGLLVVRLLATPSPVPQEEPA